MRKKTSKRSREIKKCHLSSRKERMKRKRNKKATDKNKKDNVKCYGKRLNWILNNSIYLKKIDYNIERQI